MKNSHTVKFGNLVDVKTGKLVELEVSNDLAYEGRKLVAGVLAEQAASAHLACLQSTDPNELFGIGL